MLFGEPIASAAITEGLEVVGNRDDLDFAVLRMGWLVR
jgi:hypothetical protein